MALVVVVTRDVADRFRGYLASVMLEVSAGVYVAPRMNKGARADVVRAHRVARRGAEGQRRDGLAGAGCGRGNRDRAAGIASEEARGCGWDVSGQAGSALGELAIVLWKFGFFDGWGWAFCLSDH